MGSRIARDVGGSNRPRTLEARAPSMKKLLVVLALGAGLVGWAVALVVTPGVHVWIRQRACAGGSACARRQGGIPGLDRLLRDVFLANGSFGGHLDVSEVVIRVEDDCIIG